MCDPGGHCIESEVELLAACKKSDVSNLRQLGSGEAAERVDRGATAGGDLCLAIDLFGGTGMAHTHNHVSWGCSARE